MVGPMLVVFVHGWSVRGADYGALPGWLAEQSDLETTEIWLSDYISYSDVVTMGDLVRAFERARLDRFPEKEFAAVTHSTGGPVMREWLHHYEHARRWLSHLVMLAPPNHGSALAQLGRGRLSRMAFWARGMEPGERILDWLELGSRASWRLNEAELDFEWVEEGVFLFVLAGGAHDPKFYDHLNSYTGEVGGDGVVRAASANLNYSMLRLRQAGGVLEPLEHRRSRPSAFGILPGISHTGSRHGILAGITPKNVHRNPVAKRVRECLEVASEAGYAELSAKLGEASAHATEPCSMLVFRLVDTGGNPVEDYDLLLTSGKRYSPDSLPSGFCLDRQRNQRAPSRLTYFLNYEAMQRANELGFRLIPRPDRGPVRYQAAEFRSSLARVDTVLVPHQTVMVEITMDRILRDDVYVLRRR